MSSNDKSVNNLVNVNYTNKDFNAKREYRVLHDNDSKMCEKNASFNFKAVEACPYQRRVEKSRAPGL